MKRPLVTRFFSEETKEINLLKGALKLTEPGKPMASHHIPGEGGFAKQKFLIIWSFFFLHCTHEHYD